ncbi:MAG: hypothetical protein ACOH2S_16610 [Janthinobacterium svalbardensis]|uniref:Uncharacterized protein n=1 Tax=Janthinobacterium svalbardensis TaxID=368607 RepID=A0A290WY79_9BURK|nr:hypothetical protein [Janthinobacterium svalbardensis]ATD61658.1 hypothetical protein CNX70_16935 [Janthinobacterium svalbardensis]
MPDLSPRAVIAGNIDDVRALALAAAHPHMHARTIYAGEVLAGFALYAEPGPAGRQGQGLAATGNCRHIAAKNIFSGNCIAEVL